MMVMKESEIKDAIEKVNWALLRAISTADEPTTDPEHLKIMGDEMEEALTLVKSLCNYMIDDGKIVLSEELLEIYNQSVKISLGEYGRIPEDILTDELQPLFARIFANVANIWEEIQKYWEWEQVKHGPLLQKKELAEQAKSDPELLRIFQGNIDELNKFLNVCIYAPDGTTVKREALKLGKDKIINENDVPGNLYERLKFYELINIAPSTWRGGNKKNLMK